MEYLFTIFHRLNTGGMKLNNQEIRNCIYGGIFNNFLKESDTYAAWRKLNKMRSAESYRFAKQEIILRFFALYDNANTYEGHLAKFLNTYMHDNQYSSVEFIAQKRTLFQSTVDCIVQKAIGGTQLPKLSLTVMESVLVGVARNLPALQQAEATVVAQRFRALLGHADFSETSLKEGLSKKPRVIARLQTAVRTFAGE